MLFPEEQAKQLAMTDAKMIFSLAENVDTVLKARAINNSCCPLVTLKTDRRQSVPSGAFDFSQLMDISGKHIACVFGTQ